MRPLGCSIATAPRVASEPEGAARSYATVPGVRDAYFVGITCDGAEPTNGILTPASGYFNFSAALQNLTDIVVFNPIR